MSVILQMSSTYILSNKLDYNEQIWSTITFYSQKLIQYIKKYVTKYTQGYVHVPGVMIVKQRDQGKV